MLFLCSTACNATKYIFKTILFVLGRIQCETNENERKQISYAVIAMAVSPTTPSAT